MSYTQKQQGNGSPSDQKSQQTKNLANISQQMQTLVQNQSSLPQTPQAGVSPINFANLNITLQQQQQQQHQRLESIIKQQQLLLSAAGPQIQHFQQQIQQQQNAAKELLNKSLHHQQQSNGSPCVSLASNLANQQFHQHLQAFAQSPANLMQHLQVYQYQLQQQQKKIIPLNQTQQTLTSSQIDVQNVNQQHMQQVQQQKFTSHAKTIPYNNQVKQMTFSGSSCSALSTPTIQSTNIQNRNSDKGTTAAASITQTKQTSSGGGTKLLNKSHSLLAFSSSSKPVSVFQSNTKPTSSNLSAKIQNVSTSPSIAKSTQQNFKQVLSKVHSSQVNLEKLVNAEPNNQSASINDENEKDNADIEEKPKNIEHNDCQEKNKTDASKEKKVTKCDTKAINKLSEQKKIEKEERHIQEADKVEKLSSCDVELDLKSARNNTDRMSVSVQSTQSTSSKSKSEQCKNVVKDEAVKSEKHSEMSNDINNLKKGKIQEAKEDKNQQNQQQQHEENKKECEKSDSIRDEKEIEKQDSKKVDDKLDKINCTSDSKNFKVERRKSICLKNDKRAFKKEYSAQQICNTQSYERRSKRHRLKTILYQSPLPELAYITKLSVSEASNTVRNTQEKLTLFYKTEYLAVRNADDGFFICKTLQNVYKNSKRIRIRWFSENKSDSTIYNPDFYDNTDLECILTTVELEKIGKDEFKLPKSERTRIENILKKAMDVEKGIAPKPNVTEETPDGLDISLIKVSSQIRKKTPRRKRLIKSQLKSKKIIKKKEFVIIEDNDNEDGNSDKEYKPNGNKRCNLSAIKHSKEREQRSSSVARNKNKHMSKSKISVEIKKKTGMPLIKKQRPKRRAVESVISYDEDLVTPKRFAVRSKIMNHKNIDKINNKAYD